LQCIIDGDLNVLRMQRTAREGPLALVIGDATNPADVHLADVSATLAKTTRLTHVNKRLLSRVELTQPERFTVNSGKATIEGWVIKPPGFRKGRKYPAILEIHGGPESQYGHTFYHELHWLAAKGYVVVYTNPRGSSGYGFEHMRSIFRDWGNLDYKDAMKATDWIARRPYVDTKRIGVTGGSYGGFLTNWLIGKTARYAAAVTQRSCVNWESMLGTSDFGLVIGDEFGGTPWKNHENLRRQSPLTLVKGIRENETPTLIIHSENDLRCPVEQAEQLFMSMKMLGCDVELVRFEGESHGLSRGGRPQNRRERLRRIGEWFDRKMA
jgi:dipeptidyl aminopeptidase/acylaminoacyl peptidase